MARLRRPRRDQGRRRVRHAVAVTAALLAAVLALAARAQAQGSQFYGVVAQGPLAAADYDRMPNGNVGTLRFNLSWERTEPSPGNYEFDHIDEIVGNAAARGIRSLPVISGAPEHVRNPPTRGSDRRAFRDFGHALAGRYGPGGDYWELDYRLEHPLETLALANPPPVTSWQIGNEQNGRAHWRGKPAPRAYGQLVKSGARGIRSEHRKLEIVLGGMFGTPSGKGSVTSWRYLNRLYGVKGIKRSFSTVAVHPYSPNLRGIRYQMRRVRNVMRRHNDRGKKIRVTEIGWGSARGSHSLLKGAKGQARMLRKSFRLLTRHRNRRAGWNVGGINWYSWQDGEAGCSFCPSSGLLSGPPGDRKPKRSWSAFRRAAR